MHRHTAKPLKKTLRYSFFLGMRRHFLSDLAQFAQAENNRVTLRMGETGRRLSCIPAPDKNIRGQAPAGIQRNANTWMPVCTGMTTLKQARQALEKQKPG
jgi:hypothetical protein